MCFACYAMLVYLLGLLGSLGVEVKLENRFGLEFVVYHSFWSTSNFNIQSRTIDEGQKGAIRVLNE